MAYMNPLAQLNSSRGGFIAAPPLPPRPAPVSRTNAQPTRGRGASQPRNINDIIAANEGKQRAGQQPKEEENTPAGGLLGRGLGMLLNNPVTNTILRPLDVLDVPRRAVWSTAKELADQFVGGDDNYAGGFSPQDWYDQINPFHAVTQKGDVTIGAGTVIPDTGNKWLDRGVGLAGDILADPLTYVAGVGFVADAGTSLGRVARATKLSQGVDALKAADRLSPEILESAKRVAQSGNWGQADPALRQAAGISDTAGVRMRVPFTQATSGPIPGTRVAGEAISDVMGGIRGGINASDFGRARTAKTVPVEYQNTLPLMLAGGASDDKFLRALEAIPTVNAKRAAERQVAAMGAKDMNKTVRQVKEYLASGNTVDDLIRQTEDLNSAPTPLNVLADRMRQHAADVGVDMPEIADIGYFPHVMSKEFRDLLASGGEDVQRFMDQSGIISAELLGDGGFLQTRKLRPRNGQPLKIELPNGRKTEITEGTVAEINAKMKELFPQLRGTALETDPRTALERYVTSVAQDVGNRAAAKSRIEAGSEFFGNVPGGRLESGVAGPADPLVREQSPQGYQGLPQNAFEGDQFFRGVEDEKLTELANQREATRLSDQALQQETEAQRLRTTVAGDITNTGRQVQRGLDEGLAAVDQQLADELVPFNARQADINTSRADLDIADQLGAEALAENERRLSRIAQGEKNIHAERVATRREILKINADTKLTVDGLKEYLKSINARIAGYRRQSNRLTGEQQAAWRTAREADVANARNELERLRQEADGLRTWSTQSQDRLNFQAAEKAISDFHADIKAAQKALDDITSGLTETARTRTGRTDPARIKEARNHLATSPNVERYDAAMEVVNANKGVKGADASEELLAARKFLRTKAAKRVKENRAILEPLTAQDQMIAREVAGNPLKREAESNLANVTRRATRTPAIGQTLPGGMYVDAEEVKRLFPEAGVNPRDVSFPEYLQRLRRSYGAENTISRKGKLADNIRKQNETVDEMGRAITDLWRTPSVQEQTIAARQQAEYMWKTFPEQMMKQQVQEQIVSIPAAAQAQMESLDAISTNLRMRYKEILIDKEARQAERAAIERQMGVRDAARTDLTSQEVALGNEIVAREGAAATERGVFDTIQGARGKRSIDPAADIAGGETLAPKKKDLDAFNLQTDPANIQPMSQAVNDIQAMAMFDPNMTDDVYGATEALLMQHRRQLRDITGKDLSVRQTEQLLREANSGRLIDVVAGQLRDQWTMLPGRGDTVIDTELNRMLTNILDVKREPGLFGQTLTAFTNFFKTYATLTPGFHLRNAMSAVFMNTVDGVPLRTQQRGLKLWREWAAADDGALWLKQQAPEVQDAFKATFASGAGGRFFESGVADATAINRTALKEGVYRNRFTTASQKLGEKVEGSVRLGMALDTIEGGGNVATAYDRLARIHFDYAAVSALDEKAKKLVPFWTFTSRNLPMQISEMWTKPKVYAWYNSFVRNFGVDPVEFTPEYFESVGAFNTGETMPISGLPLYLQPDLPQVRVTEDVDRFTKALQGENIGQVLSDFNPFFTAPIEYMTGTDLFTGRQYDETDWTKASGPVDTAMLPLLALLGQTKQGADGVYIQDKGMAAMRAINPLLDRTIRLTPSSSASSGDPSRQIEAMLRTLGAPIRTLSPQQQEATQRAQYFDQRDKMAMERVLNGG